MNTPNTTLQLPDHVRCTVVDDGAVLVNLKTGMYLGLNEVATRMFELWSTGRDMDQVVVALANEYEAPEDVLRTHCERFLAEARERGILYDTP